MNLTLEYDIFTAIDYMKIMKNGINPSYLYDFYLIKIKGGEILSVVGNYKGNLVRARLTYYPDKEGNIVIDGSKYLKIKLNTDINIKGAKKVLNLPGEQHFIIDKKEITKIYPLNNETLEIEFEEFRELLINNCNLTRNQISVAGSRSIKCERQESDYDVVIFDSNISHIRNFIISNTECNQELTFDINFAIEKYKVFYNLNSNEIEKLFTRRWKYINYKGLHISISFIDSNFFADNLLNLGNTTQEIQLKGQIINGDRSYFAPRLIDFIEQRTNKKYQILSWLFFYNGAFNTGDEVGIKGKVVVQNSGQFVLIETTDSYIKLLK